MSPKSVIFTQLLISHVHQAELFLSNAMLFYGEHFQVNRTIEQYNGCDNLTDSQKRRYESNRIRAIQVMRNEGICPEQWCAANSL